MWKGLSGWEMAWLVFTVSMFLFWAGVTVSLLVKG